MFNSRTGPSPFTRGRGPAAAGLADEMPGPMIPQATQGPDGTGGVMIPPGPNGTGGNTVPQAGLENAIGNLRKKRRPQAGLGDPRAQAAPPAAHPMRAMFEKVFGLNKNYKDNEDRFGSKRGIPTAERERQTMFDDMFSKLFPSKATPAAPAVPEGPTPASRASTLLGIGAELMD